MSHQLNTGKIWSHEPRKLLVDPIGGVMQVAGSGETRSIDLYSEESFEILSKLWLSVGWSRKYTYGFSWLGRPVIQLPEDLLRYQEAIHLLRPDAIVETGVAHGGSLVFCASLLEILGKGIVVGVDIEIRPHNRTAIESHPLFHRIRLLEGSSTDPAVLAQVARHLADAKTVLVLLDSCHTAEHVLAELRCYSSFVSAGSFLVVADGLMRHIAGVPGAQPWFAQSNPLEAIDRFLSENRSFQRAAPPCGFNESRVGSCVTYWPLGWLQRIV
jgi:cephalosporin hydroxylase